MTDQEIVMLSSGRQLSADQFYQERDQRMPSSTSGGTQEFSIAIVAPQEVLESASGQTAFIWGASVIRRMGRSFADVKLIAPANARAIKYEAALHRGLEIDTLGDAIDVELAGADPFAPITWRDITDPRAFSDVSFAIWIGRRAAAVHVPARGEAVVGARGWVVEIEEHFAGTPIDERRETERSAELDAAAAAIIGGVCFAVGISYSRAQSNGRFANSRNAPPSSSSESQSHPAHYWYSVDTGSATTDEEEGKRWVDRGSSQDEFAPWRPDQGEAPRLPDLVLISAGGLNGNFAQILSASYVNGSAAAVIDPDLIEISNLNRLVGASLGDVGSPKAGLVSSVLNLAAFETTVHEQAYEPWAAAHRNVLDTPDLVAIVGVDQVRSRFEAQADWPALLLNGSTAGTSWNVSWHPRGRGGCVGCLYATDLRPYAATRGPQACAAAGIPNPVAQQSGSPLQETAIANAGQLAGAGNGFDVSYPFASISAAAVMVAMCMRLTWSTQHRRTSSDRVISGVVRANALRPAFAQAGSVEYHANCSLLCQDPSLDQFFGRTPAAASAPNGGQCPVT